jgi:hypothetical protein
MENKKTATKGNKHKKKEETKTANSDQTYTKCSRNDLLRLVSEGLLQEKNVVQGRPSSINLIHKRMLMKSFCFNTLSKGD